MKMTNEIEKANKIKPGSAPAPGVRRAPRRTFAARAFKLKNVSEVAVRLADEASARTREGARALLFQLVGTIIFTLVSIQMVAAKNNSLTDAQLLQIKFDQKLNSQVSPDLVFRDETGKPIRLGDYFGKKPTVLMLGYYSCPMLCTLTLNGAIESFRDLKWSVGKNFDVIFVSIDPNETPKLAAAKKKTYLRDYGRSGSENGWHFLTGDKIPIQTLADEIGFHFAYDAGLKEYAHPSGFVVLTPGGKVAHYFFGVTFSGQEVDTALRDANVKKIDSPVEELILLCCEYSPLHGKYGNLVMDIMRAGGIGTVLALGIYFLVPRASRLPVSKKDVNDISGQAAETRRRDASAATEKTK